jgi:crotonobetainyl-CoA:carnitine CoA-transferase CaiB-like acyl-CoA transferase
LSKRKLIYAPVQDHVDLQSDHQVLDNEYIVTVDHPQAGPFKTIGNLVELSKMPGEVRSAAPELGQHTEEILLEICGYSNENIRQLREKAIIVR